MFFRVSLLAISMLSLIMKGPALSETGKTPVVSDVKQKTASVGESRTLLDALKSVEKRHGITIFLDGKIPVDQQAEPLPENATVEASLHQLLLGYDYFLQFGLDAESGVNTLKGAWIFPRAGAEDIELVSREALLGARDCSDSDTNQAYQQWIESIRTSADGGAGFISEMLTSGDKTRQNQILDAAERGDIIISRQQLENLLRDDPSEAVRAKAFSLLQMLPSPDLEEEQAILDLALTDPSSLVREMARQFQETQPIPPDENVMEEIEDENAMEAIEAGISQD